MTTIMKTLSLMKKKRLILNNKIYIKSYLIAAFLAALFVVIEGSIIALLFAGEVKPDLHLVLAVSLAFLWHETKGTISAIIIGLFQDILLGPALGFYSLSKMLSAVIVAQISREMYKEQVIGPMIIVFFITFFHESVTFFISSAFWGNEISYFYALERIFLLKALYHLLLTLFIYPLLYYADQHGII